MFLADLTVGYPTERVCQRVRQCLSELPIALRRTLTWNKGTEMTGHAQFTRDSGMPVFFCDPHNPWQRPTNENPTDYCASTSPKAKTLAMSRRQSSHASSSS